MGSQYIIKIKIVQVEGRHLRVSFLFINNYKLKLQRMLTTYKEHFLPYNYLFETNYYYKYKEVMDKVVR